MNIVDEITNKENQIKKLQEEVYEMRSRLNVNLREEYIKKCYGKVFKNKYGTDRYTYVMGVNSDAKSISGIEIDLEDNEIMISPVSYVAFSKLDLENEIDKSYISDLITFRTNQIINTINS